MARPDWLPEKFYDADKDSPRVEELARSYSEIERKFSTRNDDLAKQIKADLEKERTAKRPAKVEDYNFKVKLDDQEIEIERSNPLASWWAKTAYDMGLDQDGFQKGLDAYLDAYSKTLPDPEAELAKLGETGAQRRSSVETWIKGKLAGEAQKAFEPLLDRADGIMALEQVMKVANGDSGLGNRDGGGGTSADAMLTLEQLRTMQADPKYYDPAKRDPAFVKQIEEGYQKLAAKKAA